MTQQEIDEANAADKTEILQFKDAITQWTNNIEIGRERIIRADERIKVRNALRPVEPPPPFDQPGN
jgi:hypothetical protein